MGDFKHNGLTNRHSFVHDVNIVRIKPSEYSQFENILHHPNPYPSIHSRKVGRLQSAKVEFSNDVTLFKTSIAYIPLMLAWDEIIF